MIEKKVPLVFISIEIQLNKIHIMTTSVIPPPR